MRRIWTYRQIQKMFRQFGVTCLWYESRLSADLKNGMTRLSTDAILGFKYNDPISVTLIRTSVSQHIINTEQGNLYEGGAKFQIPPIVIVNGVVTQLNIYDRIFKGDIIVVQNKPIRDFDVLRKGKRDSLFAFDVRKILSVKSVPLGSSATPADHIEYSYTYGIDYKIQINGTDADVSIQTDGSIIFNTPVPTQATAMIDFVWIPDDNPPLDPPVIRKRPPEGSQYVVEFSTAPNYIIWDELSKARGTEGNDLPKAVMAVKRAYVSGVVNPIDSIPTNQTIQNDEVTDFDEEANIDSPAPQGFGFGEFGNEGIP